METICIVTTFCRALINAWNVRFIRLRLSLKQVTHTIFSIGIYSFSIAYSYDSDIILQSRILLWSLNYNSRVYEKKLYWKARTTTTLSIAPSSVPSVEIIFFARVSRNFWTKNFTSDAYLAIHYSNVTMIILYSQIDGNPTVCLTVCLD